jgi:hypothetical protein
MHKLILRILLIAIAVPSAGLAIWYEVSFLPHVNRMEEMARTGYKEAKPVIDCLHKYAVTAETESGIRQWAIRQAYRSLVYNEKRSSIASWHANNALWYLASHIHFNDEDTFGLWLSCSISGCGKGFQIAAKEYYGKALRDLNKRELIGLVAVVKSPSLYKPGSANSENRIEHILRNTQSCKIR